MTLIKSISGIRGTIGGKTNEALTPVDIVKYTSAFGTLIRQKSPAKKIKIVLGRDARISGEMVEKLVLGALSGLGIDVINLGMATTPTVEIAVIDTGSDGGIILTASHNPKHWNALKLLNESGEFISAEDGEKVLKIAENEDFLFTDVDTLGKVFRRDDYNSIHIDKIIQLPLVDVNAIKNARFKIGIDCVNSVGGLIIPQLLKKLGITEVIELNCEANGIFAHNPEPLPEHLTEISQIVVQKKADLGFVVDPDVDRLAIICEDGTMFGEEFTLVSIADYILSVTPGNTVSNLSSTRALKELTATYGLSYSAAAVGEVNVVKKMKEINAIIGGEGNGGVIYPELHYGRDALVGIALFLTHLAKSNLKCSQLRAKYPFYVISKNKIQLTSSTNVENILEKIQVHFKEFPINNEDGVKIEFEEGWIHLRKSNTEPIIRIYSEGENATIANALAQKIIDFVNEIF